MRHQRSRVGRIAFAAATVAALGFGAAEAFARPVEPARAGPYCDPATCDAHCRSIGGESGACYSVGCLCVH
jgi:hypothetical protein